jgi:hypothetical protein
MAVAIRGTPRYIPSRLQPKVGFGPVISHLANCSGRPQGIALFVWGDRKGSPYLYGAIARDRPYLYGAIARDRPYLYGATARDRPYLYGATARDRPYL